MISGRCSLGREEPLEKHAKRLLRFLTALVVWSLLYYIWNIFYDGRDYDLRQIWYVPTKAHLWYLYAMIPIYLVLPFFQILCRNMTMKLEKGVCDPDQRSGPYKLFCRCGRRTALL